MNFCRESAFALSLICLLFIACSTLSPRQAVEPSPELPDCYCGRPINSQESCAVWPVNRPDGELSPVLQTVSSSSCDLNVCQENFQSHCQSIKLWPYPNALAKLSPQELCYCDSVWIELDRKPKIACAAWSPATPWLIEYHLTDQECTPESCKSSPFQLASKFCPKGFQAFYSPWGAAIKDAAQEAQ